MKRDIRLLALDLDGTTFNSRKIITQHTREVLQAACEKGVIVMPATGRARWTLPEAFLSIPGVRYALTSSGSIVWDLEKNIKIHEDYLDTKTAAKITDWFLTLGEHTQIVHDGRFYSDRTGYEKFIKGFDRFPQFAKEYVISSRIPVDNLSEYVRSGTLNIEKVLITFEDTSLCQMILNYLKRFDDVYVTPEGRFMVEVTPKTASKGRTLVKFGEKLGIAREQIMICGDGMNDRSMFEEAGFAVAMGNACDEIKEMADFVTLTNDEDGVAYAVEKFILN